MTRFVSKARPLPSLCPQGCGTTLIERQAGVWCARCRGWLREMPGIHGTIRVIGPVNR